VPEGLSRVGEWAPVVLLLLTGAWNLRNLLAGDTPGGPRSWAVGWLRVGDRPWAVVAVGFVFGLAFDTASQAAAWGYAAAAGAGPLAAVGVGLVFTAGMAATDTLDGRLAVGADRRLLGWFTVGLAFVVAGQLALAQLDPRFGLSEAAVGWVGAALMAVLLAFRARGLAPGSGTRASG